jgi:hypothetical protein
MSRESVSKQTAVIIERHFVDGDGKVVVLRHPEWKVACWDAVEGLPDDDARFWALDKLLWELWERGVDVERIVAFARDRYRARTEQSADDEAAERIA